MLLFISTKQNCMQDKIRPYSFFSKIFSAAKQKVSDWIKDKTELNLQMIRALPYNNHHNSQIWRTHGWTPQTNRRKNQEKKKGG